MPASLPFIQDSQLNEEADLTAIHSIQAKLRVEEPTVKTLEFAPFIPDRELFAPGQTDYISFKTKLIRISLTDTETTLISGNEKEKYLIAKAFFNNRRFKYRLASKRVTS